MSLLFQLALAHLFAFAPVAGVSSCLTTNGRSACGYSCVAAHGQVACARTPSGICKATSDNVEAPGVVCWDPPDWVRAHYADNVPRADCITRNGSVVCGYACTGLGDEMACAQSPDGICRASSKRGVVCWDPSPSTYCADNKPLPRPQCIMSDGEIACGYGCEARGGNMACAATPGGKCNIFPSEIICTDPEAPLSCGGRPCVPDSPASPRGWCRPHK